MWVGGEEGPAGAGEGVVQVLDYEHGLAHGLAGVEEHGDLLVHGVGRDKHLAFLGEVLLEVLVVQPLEVQGQAHPQHERARPRAQHLDLAVAGASCSGGVHRFHPMIPCGAVFQIRSSL